jgi:hypothetical protein
VGDSVIGSGIPSDSFITNISGGFFAINNSYSDEIISSALTISRPPGRFLLNEIELAGIDAENCANKALTIKAYNSTSSSPLATYEVFSNGTDVTSASGQIEVSFDDVGDAAILLTIEEPTVAATDVYRITIESRDLTNLSIYRFGVWAGSPDCQPGLVECLIPTDASEDFYCANGVCNIVFLPVTDFLQLVYETECNGDEQCTQELTDLGNSSWSLSETNSQDPEMSWEILITPPGLFQSNLHMSGQILYSNGQYAVFRWYINTGNEPDVERQYNDLIISFSGSLPTSDLYDGPPLSIAPFEVQIYELSWNYPNG